MAIRSWFLKKHRSSEEKPRNALKHPRALQGQNPGLAPPAKSFRKYQKSNATSRTGQCDVFVIYFQKCHSKCNQPIFGNCCNLVSLLERYHNVANKYKIP